MAKTTCNNIRVYKMKPRYSKQCNGSVQRLITHIYYTRFHARPAILFTHAASILPAALLSTHKQTTVLWPLYRTTWKKLETIGAVSLPACPCHPVSHLIRKRWLQFFGHVACVDPKQNHHRVIGAPSHWRRPCGRSRTTWYWHTVSQHQDPLSHSEKPVTTCSGNVPSTWQHSIRGHANEEEGALANGSWHTHSDYGKDATDLSGITKSLYSNYTIIYYPYN